MQCKPHSMYMLWQNIAYCGEIHYDEFPHKCFSQNIHNSLLYTILKDSAMLLPMNPNSRGLWQERMARTQVPVKINGKDKRCLLHTGHSLVT